MFNDGGAPEEPQAFQDNMVFTLDPQEIAEENNDVDPMWSSASSRDLDWFLTDE